MFPAHWRTGLQYFSQISLDTIAPIQNFVSIASDFETLSTFAKPYVGDIG
jgi:hypothetical protein